MDKTTTLIRGIECYHPEVAEQNTDFDPAIFATYDAAIEKSFWYKSRNKIIGMLVGKYIDISRNIKFLEIGCGTGYVLKGLAKFTNIERMGSDIYVQGLEYAQKRVDGAKFCQFDATDMPFENEIDAIGMFDVLEHIEEDTIVMNNVHKALKANGLFFITVPQHPFLWSELDEIQYHKRRYTRSELVSKLEKAGFRIQYISSFVTSVFPAMLLSRLRKKRVTDTKDPASLDLKIAEPLNTILYMAMQIDIALMKLHISLPFGGSLCCVAKKIN